MSRFYFAGSDDSGSEFDESNSNLPFPKPISRSAFLAQDFDPATFLASLSDRHQTLEDLRTELRDLSASLKKELVDLVNSNYQDFLSLGLTLKGGEERVEEVRVGLLGFQRDLGAVGQKVGRRREEFAASLATKRSLQKDIGLGEQLLGVEDRICALEEKLLINGNKNNESKSEEHRNKIEETSDSEDGVADFDSLDEGSGEDELQETDLYLRNCQRRVDQYLVIIATIQRIGQNHPYITAQKSRIDKIRSTLLLDLGNAMKAAKAADNSNSHKDVIMGMYEKMEERIE
ncbi:MAG: hypothetical protein Q9227_001426 [Pyrenula ochraceoflavens]